MENLKRKRRPLFRVQGIRFRDMKGYKGMARAKSLGLFPWGSFGVLVFRIPGLGFKASGVTLLKGIDGSTHIYIYTCIDMYMYI